MKLTVLQIKSAKPKEKEYKLSDGKGLYLLVNPNGSKYWRFRYRYLGKERTLALGFFPEVSLTEARDGTLEARRQIRLEQKDPSAEKKKAKIASQIKERGTFEKAAIEWVDAYIQSRRLNQRQGTTNASHYPGTSITKGTSTQQGQKQSVVACCAFVL